MQHLDPKYGMTLMLNEQVSHHPPVSAYHIENRALGLTLYGHNQTKVRFLGNSVEVGFGGQRTLKLRGPWGEEEYSITIPSLCFRGILVGSKGSEWAGLVRASVRG
jgi:oxysterol-binding protein-related protein 9/10/11